MEDINAALYTVVSHYVLPFTLPDDSQALVRKFTGTAVDLMQNKKAAMAAFLQELLGGRQGCGLLVGPAAA